MSFQVKINSILRSDDYRELVLGKTYPFEKTGSRIFVDNLPIWLTKKDWTALAEISIVSQTLAQQTIKGEFRVDYIYQGTEQQVLTDTFIRLYAGQSDPFIYLLSSQAEYQQAKSAGVLVRDSLQAEGFIHASPKSQLNRLANKYYKQKAQPLILTLDKKQISAVVRWEPAKGGLYPHIYGPLNINAVTAVSAIALTDDGEFHL